jgi:hypothetical protein
VPFGTLDTYVTLVSDNAVSTVTDSFLNVNADGNGMPPSRAATAG